MLNAGRWVRLAGLLTLLGCSQSTMPERGVYEFRDSFESGVSAWTIRSLDDKVDTVTIDWYVVSSNERASQDSLSAKVFMDNLSDAAKVWLERSLQVEPGETYSVRIRFDLASCDYSDVNLFSLLANVLPHQPTSSDHIVSGLVAGDFPEGTYNGGVEGYAWLDKILGKTVVAGDDGRLYFILGIWGTWEGARTYYFDDVEVVVIKQ